MRQPTEAEIKAVAELGLLPTLEDDPKYLADIDDFLYVCKWLDTYDNPPFMDSDSESERKAASKVWAVNRMTNLVTKGMIVNHEAVEQTARINKRFPTMCRFPQYRDPLPNRGLLNTLMTGLVTMCFKDIMVDKRTKINPMRWLKSEDPDDVLLAHWYLYIRERGRPTFLTNDHGRPEYQCLMHLFIGESHNKALKGMTEGRKELASITRYDDIIRNAGAGYPEIPEPEIMTTILEGIKEATNGKQQRTQ